MRSMMINRRSLEAVYNQFRPEHILYHPADDVTQSQDDRTDIRLRQDSIRRRISSG